MIIGISVIVDQKYIICIWISAELTGNGLVFLPIPIISKLLVELLLLP